MGYAENIRVHPTTAPNVVSVCLVKLFLQPNGLPLDTYRTVPEIPAGHEAGLVLLSCYTISVNFDGLTRACGVHHAMSATMWLEKLPPGR